MRIGYPRLCRAVRAAGAVAARPYRIADCVYLVGLAAGLGWRSPRHRQLIWAVMPRPRLRQPTRPIRCAASFGDMPPNFWSPSSAEFGEHESGLMRGRTASISLREGPYSGRDSAGCALTTLGARGTVTLHPVRRGALPRCFSCLNAEKLTFARSIRMRIGWRSLPSSPHRDRNFRQHPDACGPVVARRGSHRA